MNECMPYCKATKLLVAGIIFILVRWFWPMWDIWMVIGVLLILKAIMMYIMPNCACHMKEGEAKKKR